MREMVISFPVLLIVYALIVGFGSSPLFSVPPSMIGDIVDQQEFLTGNRNEGVYFGMLNFGYKISQSIAIFFLGIVLDLVGFKAGISSQSTLTVLSIGLVLSLGSLLSFVGALFAYRHYDLNQETIEAIQLSIVHRNSDEVQ
jgi:GPH family glycoside/pentoside/hexuronide:cation symporter